MDQESEDLGDVRVLTPQMEKPNYLDKLKDQKSSLQQKMDDIDNAIKLLNDNPDILEVLNALKKVQRVL